MTAKFLPVDPFDYVVFGGTGDLALRKLLPALFLRDRDGQIPPDARIIGVSRRDIGREAYVAQVEAGLARHLGADAVDAATWSRFHARLYHQTVDAAGDAGWDGLAALLADHPGAGPDRIRVFYLATAPDLFGPVCTRLRGAGVITPATRIVLEKPIGTDPASARAINTAVGAVVDEHQVFRIDHYLGKETVQNLMALRFANALFEPIWNATAIEHVQITVAESVGVESRAAYYDKAGALRDMVQNHILQLLCLVAMEPPTAFDADAVRDEKLKVLRALAPLSGRRVAADTVRGQYEEGVVDGTVVPGYAAELDQPDSTTETFVALRVAIENWRWAGVPFYLRTGKRLRRKLSDIVIQFRPVPHSIFEADAGPVVANRLTLRLQPDEAVTMQLMTKEPGPGGMRLRTAPLNLSFAETFKRRTPDAYERLLLDVVRGNSTLFMRRDEVDAAWAWTGPVLQAWQETGQPVQTYMAGSSGPAAANRLIERDGHSWADLAS